MRMGKSALRAAVACTVLGMGGGVLVFGADWPQWRGANRDAKVTDFKAPQTWPKELKQDWKQSVGLGDATPALVGDRLYVFSRRDSDEVTQCLDAGTGKPIWEDKYSAITVNPPAGNEHAGPRSSPAVAEGKVVTFGVGSVLSCLDANTGKVVWRKDSGKDYSPGWPAFYTAMSPLIVDGMCIAHLGGSAMGGMGGGGGGRGRGGGAGPGGGPGGGAPGGGPPPAAAAGPGGGAGSHGAVVAFDLNTGEPKWKWEGEPPAYASPVVATIDGTRQIIDVGDQSIVGLSIADGKLLWKASTRGGGAPGGGPPGGGPGAGGPPPAGGPGGGGGRGGPGGGGGGRMGGGRGGGMSNNAATPVVEGDTIIFAGQGVRALKIQKQGDAYEAKEQWNNPEISTNFSTPVLKDGKIYGLASNNSLFCLNAADGKKVWAQDLQAAAGGGGAPPGAGAPGGAGGGGRGRGGGMGRGGFGSIVDAGSVLIALSPSSEMIVLKPGDQFAEVARIKVGNSPIYAYPVFSGNHLFIKDQDAVTAHSIE